MGRRGPKPQPTAQKRLRGNPGKRALNDREPTPALAVPACPDFLNSDARAEWDRIVPELQALNLLTRVDRAALACYCQAWATFKLAQAQLDKYGLTMEFESKAGTLYEMARPEVAIANKAMQQIKAFSAEFGFTPSARTAIKLPDPPKQKDKARDFLKFDKPRLLA